MTDGTVEKADWHSGYGYSIVVHAPEGGDFFYAHLDSFDREYVTGEEVRAGDILGYMGNIGFGLAKTKGRIPVHLHVGNIHIRSGRGKHQCEPILDFEDFCEKNQKVYILTLIFYQKYVYQWFVPEEITACKE